MMGSQKSSTAKILSVLLLTLIFVAAGCASSVSDSQPSTDVVQSSQPLPGVQLSNDLSASQSIQSCDVAVAIRNVDDPLPHGTNAAAQMLWDSCQKLYVCSPISALLLKSWFAHGEFFRLGFVDFSKLTKVNLPEHVAGVYLGGTKDVYLSKKFKDPWQACPLLLHELVHRFDPDAQSSKDSLRIEYKAYWYEIAFLDELYLRNDILGDFTRGRIAAASTHAPISGLEVRSDRIQTRGSLLKAVAKAYGFKYDASIANEYPLLPREAAVPLAEEVKADKAKVAKR